MEKPLPSPMSQYTTNSSFDSERPIITNHQPNPKPTSTHTSTIDIQEKILYELERLNELQSDAIYEPNKNQAVWNALLQLFGIGVGLVFGVFAALAWKVETDANELSKYGNAMAEYGIEMTKLANNLARTANEMAIAAYCQSQPQNATGELCEKISVAAALRLAVYAEMFYGVTGDGNNGGVASPYDPSYNPINPVLPTATSQQPVTSIVWIIVGVIGGVVVLGGVVWLQIKIYKEKTNKIYKFQKIVDDQ